VIRSRIYLWPLALIAACSTEPAQEASAPKPPSGETAELVTYTEERERCRERSATRNAYFGDLHVHTGFSYDVRPFDTNITPRDAYRFARGQPITIPVADRTGTASRTAQIDRPLDFAAVTDHSEFFGELKLCRDPQSAVYETPLCTKLRQTHPGAGFQFIKVLLEENPQRISALCGDSDARCRQAAISLWQITQDMAEAAYDRSEQCEFTTFVGYEHTGTPQSNNYHRNVIFRNAQVPAEAISYIDTPTDKSLWAQLTAQCLEGIEGCDVLAIPHNSNLSAGAMFPSYMSGFESTQDAYEMAQLRNRMEPVMEVFQHKGNSECFNGFPDILGEPDELCNVEQVRTIGPRTGPQRKPYDVTFCEDGDVGYRGFLTLGCISKNDFFRSVLLTGLQDQKVLGVNSYKFGVIASTDTHTGLAGHTHERQWMGHIYEETTLKQRLNDLNASPQRLTGNPGGLAGVWAVENTRDAIFEALERREVFGTTGTRIKPRFFAGWAYAQDACGRADLPSYGYDGGVAMGSDLTAPPPGAKPKFIVSAQQDAQSAGLQKLQLIKGWIDENGQSRYKVIDVASVNQVMGALDLKTGDWSGDSAPSLCAVYEDDDFDPGTYTYYYMRAVEVPTFRWSTAQCQALPQGERPEACETLLPQTLQEMAWTSPIWYAPPSAPY